jgi:transcriptional regulator with XRE-family HTH domain
MSATRTLRTVREAQGKSLRRVAYDAGLDPGSLSKIERGLREPRTATLRRICEALDLKAAAELLGTFAPDGTEAP